MDASGRINRLKNRHWVLVCALIGVWAISSCCRVSRGSSDRYGLFGLLDHRSIYGQYWFPEPLKADESDVDNEIRVDWSHEENPGRQFDAIKTEFEKSFGLLTLEIAPTYESDRTRGFNSIARRIEGETRAGFGNVELGVRHPVFQFVSGDGFVDTTLVAGNEVTVPTGSKISKDVEWVPKLFSLTRIGDRVSIELGAGDSILVGPQGRGLSTLEYSAVLGYELIKTDLPLPGMLSTTPLLEFDGQYALNQAVAGHNQLFCAAGFRFNFDSISWLPAQPRLGIGYTFPVDKGARDEFRWGIVTSLVFEY